MLSKKHMHSCIHAFTFTTNICQTIPYHTISYHNILLYCTVLPLLYCHEFQISKNKEIIRKPNKLQNDEQEATAGNLMLICYTKSIPRIIGILSVVLVVCQQLWYNQKTALFNNDNSFLPPIVNDVGTSSSFAGLHRAMMGLFESIPISNQQPEMKPTTLKNLICRLDAHDNRDIVLATHITTSKFQALLTQLKYWKGPASIAVYIKTKEDIDSFFRFIGQNQPLLKTVTFHLVMEKTDMPYPHNILRNVAVEAVESGHIVILLDVDLIPMPEGCHDRLLAALKSPSSELFVNKKKMFVLPAFQIKQIEGNTHASEDQLPLSKGELIEKLKTKEVVPFHLKEFELGHGPTNFTKWINLPSSNDTTFYDIPNDSRVKNGSFEPYVIAFKFGLPRYWEDFRGFGINKQSYFQECSRAGYTFAVMHNFYCVHLDHPIIKLSNKVEQLSSNSKVHQTFMKHLHEFYGGVK